MDIELERNDLDKSIEVLSSAAQALQLTRFQSLSYRALMLSVDVATVTLATVMLSVLFLSFLVLEGTTQLQSWTQSRDLAWELIGFSVLCAGLSIFIGLVSLVLNIPLFVRVLREGARLKKLGLSSLSKSLWIEGRRSRWMRRARSYLLIGMGVFLMGTGIIMSITGWESVYPEDRKFFLVGAVFVVLIGVLLLAARYLRNQRERIDLTANAEELRKTLQSLRQRAGDVEVVTVPSELLEQSAKIESVQIAKQRKEAILQSIDSPSKEYAIAFDRSAVEGRATLGIADRVELEDLVEQLSAEAAELEPQAPAGAGANTALRAATKTKRVKVDYLIDQASKYIRITAVRQAEAGSTTPESGADHA
jgi:hypothetical protein